MPCRGLDEDLRDNLAALFVQNYPRYEVVFVDDGSKDRTYEMVKAAFKGDKRVKVLTKTNGGKASALNFGLKKCAHDFVVCIDADTQLDPNALRELAKPFVDPQVGAVAGNVRVGNEVNMLTKWQSIEYITAQNFDRLAFAYLNCITVVPGAIGAFRREAIGSVGLYETDTLAEDCDLTMRIIRKGYRVAQNNKAIAITESPENFAQFMNELRDTADKLMYSRRLLIDLSQDFNAKIVTFPGNIIASLFGFHPEKGLDVPVTGDMLSVTPEDTQAPKVSF